MNDHLESRLTARHVHFVWVSRPSVGAEHVPYQCRLLGAKIKVCGVSNPEDFNKLWAQVLAALSVYGCVIWDKTDRFKAEIPLEYPVFAIPVMGGGTVSLPVAADDLGQVAFIHTGVGYDGSITSLRGLN